VEHAISVAKSRSESYKFCNTLHCGSLHNIYDHIYDAIVVVLDVMMPGNSEKDIKVFVRNYVGCPIILFTSCDDLKLSDFPGAFDIVHKAKGIESLADAIYRALESHNTINKGK
jgi:FixJ family two-component response regulator